MAHRRIVKKNTADGVVALAYALVFGLAYIMLVERPADTDSIEMWSIWRRGLILTTGVGLTLGAILWYPILTYQAVGKVLLPLALPDVVNSLRLLFGLAFGYIMLAEVIDAEYGIGHIINQSRRIGPREHIYLCLIIIALLAYGIDRLILFGQRYLFPYKMAES